MNFMIRTPHCLSLCLALLASPSLAADRLPVIIGGDEGNPWANGGGTIPSLVKTSESSAEETNTPGGVLDLDVEAYPNWAFPQQIDSTRSILIGLTDTGRGGSVFTPTISFQAFEADFPLMFDDDPATAFAMRAARPGESAGGRGLLIQFDLGAIFSVDRVKFFPRNADPAYPAPGFPFQDDFIKGYELLTNDGSRETNRNGSLQWTRIDIQEQNEKAVVDIQFPPRFIRYIRFRSLSNIDFEIAELQVFSLGFVPQATYVSNIFDFGTPALLGNIRWVQDHIGDERRSRVRVRTRAGRDRQPLEFTRIGVQNTGRTRTKFNPWGSSEEDILIDAAWKKAEDLEDAPRLSEAVSYQGLTVRTPQDLVEQVLDNADVPAQEVLLVFDGLAAEDRQAVSLDLGGYFDLEEGERTGIDDDLTSWSPWSPPYTTDGVVDAIDLANQGAGISITSPDGRQYFQFMIEFEGDIFDAATGIGGLAFDVAAPTFADSLVGEIAPRAVTLGEETEFTYAVLIKVGAGEGFDRFEITTPVRASAVGLVQIERPDGRSLDADFSSTSLDQLPQTVNGVTIEQITSTALTLSFPEIDEDGTLLKVRFTNGVLRFGTRFDSRALSGENRIGQQVLAGNAADLNAGGVEDPDVGSIGSLKQGNLAVSVPISKDLLVNVKAAPAVFSPNGDGINDESIISYDVTNIGKETDVKVRIYDLGGRLVRAFDNPRTSGRYGLAWDGRDDSQRYVTPGNYIFRVSIEARSAEFAQVGIVAVAY